MRYSGAGGKLIHEKTIGKKSRDTVLLKQNRGVLIPHNSGCRRINPPSTKKFCFKFFVQLFCMLLPKVPKNGTKKEIFFA